MVLGGDHSLQVSLDLLLFIALIELITLSCGYVFAVLSYKNNVITRRRLHRFRNLIDLCTECGVLELLQHHTAHEDTEISALIFRPGIVTVSLCGICEGDFASANIRQNSF